ncbi:MAG: phenylacetic acid degradation operon negative regulatory protein PaaX [Woeseia sp.]
MSLETVTRSLIEEFRSRPTLRAGSLIVTVFGDAIAPRGGTVWIGSLIRVMTDFGISERLVRTSVFRLARDGWLDVDQVGRQSYYRLTDEGARRFAQATHRIYREPRQTWEGNWCLVLTAGLDSERRELVRKELSWLGFGAIGADVLAHPSPDQADLDAQLKRLDSGDLVVMSGRGTGPTLQNGALRGLVHRSWNLQDIEHRYEAFLGRFRPVFAASKRGRSIRPQTAFQIRTLMLQEYRKVLLRDPLLPADLLPRAWHGVPAYQLCRNLYRRVYSAADDFMSETMETAEGPLPPPSPDFYRRFGGLEPGKRT